MKFSAYVLLSLAPMASAVSGRFLRSDERQSSKTMAKTKMGTLYPFYHSTSDIRQELQRLASSCPGFTLQSMDQGGGAERSIDVATVRAPGSNPVNKNFLLFGEHARELISPESGLHLLKSLCGETDLSERARSVLQDSEFQVVVNGNPGSRQKVEQGDFCLRVNPDGVDLNRNWDEEWSPDVVFDSKDTFPGKQPFSESETKIFKNLVSDYKPTTFLTIHSGTEGMYMPWAYDMEHLANRNQPQMMKILKDLDKDHCQCPFGAAGREVGYSCPGTCLDWVYDKLQTPYAFAFEIYIGGEERKEDLRRRWQEKLQSEGASFIQTNSHLAHEHFKDVFEQYPSSFVQLRSSTEGNDDDDEDEEALQRCFSQFNPSSEGEYSSVVDNWSGAYLDMAAMIAANLKGGTGNRTAGHIGVTV